jgi:hypothetical protein
LTRPMHCMMVRHDGFTAEWKCRSPKGLQNAPYDENDVQANAGGVECCEHGYVTRLTALHQHTVAGCTLVLRGH